MRIRWMRYWLAFFAALFVANNVAAAVRGCLLELGGTGHAAIQAQALAGNEPPCPVGEAAARCATHCVQSTKDDGQKFSIDVSAPVFAPPASGPGLWVQTAQRDLVIASAEPVFRPPLTILFRNYRN